MKIAVVGGGIAGATVAHFLSRDPKHEITVFEREAILKPLGAGIMLQPTGKKVLELLGKKEFLEQNAHPIYTFRGFLESGKEVIHLDFRELEASMCGYGVHRGLLFSSLVNSLQHIGNVTLKTGYEATAISQNERSTSVVFTNGEREEGFDLMIVANGSRSLLRDSFQVTKISKPQNASALWATLPYESGELEEHSISQYYGKGVLGGVMPIGYNPLENSKQKIVNFFWGVNGTATPIVSDADFKKHKAYFYRYFKTMPSIVDKLEHKEQLVFAPYFDSQLLRFYEGRVAFIGDIAHAMSPQLSSGTNLALLDAFELAKCLKETASLPKALHQFSINRIRQVHYYQAVSRIVTPIFQNNVGYPFVRDVLMQKMYETPITRKILLETLMGIRDGWLSRLSTTYY